MRKSRPPINLICDIPIPQTEIVIHNEDDSYTIFLRPDLMGEARQRAIAHALDHIDKDWNADAGDVQQIESRAHGLN